MRLSTNFTKTSRDFPSDETSRNAQLLIKAGFIHKAMAGVYAYLPLGLRVLGKIENIVRKNMDEIGGQEILMNNLQPKEWWVQVENRWETVDVLFHVPSQTKAEYALSQSNEEQVTMIAKSFLNSYKDLPDTSIDGKALAIYQIHTKFRDEVRSKAGLMRGRDFRMKDMYDFHLTSQSQDAFYETVRHKYSEIYQQMGLVAYCTRASGGAFSKFSHEFQVITEAGEDWLVCWSDGVKDNLEIAKGKPTDTNKASFGEMALRTKLDQNVQSAQNHAENSNLPTSRILKSVLFETKGGDLIGVCIRGDLKVNEELLIQVLENTSLNGQDFGECLDLESVGTQRGRFSSVLEYQKNLKKPVLWLFDKSLEGACGLVSSLWENVDIDRDCVKPEKYAYLSEVKLGFIREDEESVVCQKVVRSAEVGNIFKLGNKWTKESTMNLFVTGQDNKPIHPLMGCYGIGVSRCMGVIAEIYSDEFGLKWPESVTPFQFHIISGSSKNSQINQKIQTLAKDIYDGELKLIKQNNQIKILNPNNLAELSKFVLSDLQSVENEVLWDDRENISIGQKLKDADLIGCPHQIIITEKSLENGGIEIKNRKTGEVLVVQI